MKTWGGGSTDAAHRCAVDVLNNIIVVGSFAGTVDFDPGEGEDLHTSINVDVSLMQLSASGNYIWGVDWGNMDGCVGNAIDIDFNDQIYVLGNFESTVDFDPGPGETFLSSHGQTDVYINQFDSDGLHVLAYGWGGSGFDTGNDLFIDGNENFYITGGFQDVVDLDPTSGYDLHTANGSASDAYFSVFNSLLLFVGARTGVDLRKMPVTIFAPTIQAGFLLSALSERPLISIPRAAWIMRSRRVKRMQFWRSMIIPGITCVLSPGEVISPTGLPGSFDQNSGELVVSGHFRGDADFDPGPLSEIHSSNGQLRRIYIQTPLHLQIKEIISFNKN